MIHRYSNNQSMRPFLHNVYVCMRSFWRRQCISVEQGLILISASKVWLWVQRDGGYMKFPDMDQESFVASPASGNESWGGEGGDRSDSPRKSLGPSPRIGWSRIKVDVLSSWSPPTNFVRPSATGSMHFPFLVGNITSFALSLFE